MAVNPSASLFWFSVPPPASYPSLPVLIRSFLLIVILAVLAGVAFFMIRLARRELENLDPELQDDYVPSR